MLHKKFHQNEPSGYWKEDFKSDFTIYRHGSHLGHVTSIILILYLQAYIHLAENGRVVTEKSKLIFIRTCK